MASFVLLLFPYILLKAFAVKFPCGKVSCENFCLRSHICHEHICTVFQLDNQTHIQHFQTRQLDTPTDFKQKGSKVPPSHVELPKWVFVQTLNAPKSRIVGGNPSLLGEFPWQCTQNHVILSDCRSLGGAGGALNTAGVLWRLHLNQLCVITAAHCPLGNKNGSLYIRVGEHDVSKTEGTEQNLNITRSISHPRYDSKVSLYNHDIALSTLQSPICFAPNVRPICLGPVLFSNSLLQSGSLATVSVWGRLRFQGRNAETLQKVELPYVERTVCKEISSDLITYFMFCAGYSDSLVYFR